MVVTLIGRRRHTVHAQADFDSELRAQEALATVRAALLAQGWIVGPTIDARPNNSAMGPDGCYFGCSDAAWKRRAHKEMPPRPAAPPPNTAQR